MRCTFARWLKLPRNGASVVGSTTIVWGEDSPQKPCAGFIAVTRSAAYHRCSCDEEVQMESVYDLGDFELQSGEVLPDGKLSYETHAERSRA